jgi:hypothetical protein
LEDRKDKFRKQAAALVIFDEGVDDAADKKGLRNLLRVSQVERCRRGLEGR